MENNPNIPSNMKLMIKSYTPIIDRVMDRCEEVKLYSDGVSCAISVKLRRKNFAVRMMKWTVVDGESYWGKCEAWLEDLFREEGSWNG